MSDVVLALVPAFFAGLAVQRFLDLIVDPLGGWALKDQRIKKIVFGLIALALGIALAITGLRVLQPLNQSPGTFQVPAVVDVIVTGLIISGGTESFNSILKFLGAAKEEKKATVAEAQR